MPTLLTGNEIRNKRRELKLSQAQFIKVAHLECTVACLSYVEAGISQSYKIRRLATDYFGGTK